MNASTILPALDRLDKTDVLITAGSTAIGYAILVAGKWAYEAGHISQDAYAIGAGAASIVFLTVILYGLTLFKNIAQDLLAEVPDDD